MAGRSDLVPEVHAMSIASGITPFGIQQHEESSKGVQHDRERQGQGPLHAGGRSGRVGVHRWLHREGAAASQESISHTTGCVHGRRGEDQQSDSFRVTHVYEGPSSFVEHDSWATPSRAHIVTSKPWVGVRQWAARVMGDSVQGGCRRHDPKCPHTQCT